MAQAKKEPEAKAAGTRLMFLGGSPNPARDTFSYAGAEEPVPHGGTFEVDADTYEAWQADPNIAPLLKEVDTDYSESTRAELEEQASDAGVANPDDLEAYPTNESVAAAIEQAKEAAEHSEAEETSEGSAVQAEEGNETSGGANAQEAEAAPTTPVEEGTQ